MTNHATHHRLKV